jgi:chromosome segregation ATPase
MSDINAFEGRITSALDRIAKGLDAIQAAETPAAPEGPSPEAEAEIARLTQLLEDERTVTAQLEERVKAVKDKLEERDAAMAQSLEEAQASVTALDTELQQLRDVNEKLRDSNVALRDANAAGLADPELINAAMMAELESLRAGRATDMAEMGAVLTQLDAILGTSDNEESADA